ncbi:hypothetical protein ACFX13_041117 [Malus domestica]
MKSITRQDFHGSWLGLCARFCDKDRQKELLQECVFIMWRIWKSRNEMVFKGVLTNPMEGVHLVRHQLIEFRACHNSKKQVVVLCEEGDGAIFAGQSVRWRQLNYGVMVHGVGRHSKEDMGRL